MKMRFYALIATLALTPGALLARDAAATDPAATTQVRNPTGDMIHTLMLTSLFVVGFWLLFILPQKKKTKELEATLKALKPGDKIVTGSGILGVVLSIKDKTVSIRSAESKMEVLKSSVLEVLEKSGETSESKS